MPEHPGVPPVSVRPAARALNRWDLLAVLLVVGLLVLLARASRELMQPLGDEEKFRYRSGDLQPPRRRLRP
jgi:hypothetical protein